MRSIVAAGFVCVLATAAVAGECPGNPNALGTARTIYVDPAEHPRIGSMQYRETLPLEDKEVVLTFDDGPLPPKTPRVLEILASECVKATFFIVGQQARAFPALVRRAYNEGHTIATHSQTHPRHFERLAADRMTGQVDDGIAATEAALGDPRALAPFFRVPGLRSSAALESYLASRDIMLWSADFPADDWRHISANQVLKRAIDRLEEKGRGVLLLHDIQPATVKALPDLLKELKIRGYRIVHVAVAGPEQPKTVTTPEQWVLHASRKPALPAVAAAPELPVASPQSFGWPHLFRAEIIATTTIRMKLTRHQRHHAYQTVRVAVAAQWPARPAHVTVVAAASLPVPSPRSFGMPHPFGPKIALPLPREEADPPAAVSEQAGPHLHAIAWPRAHSVPAPVNH